MAEKKEFRGSPMDNVVDTALTSYLFTFHGITVIPLS
jgi:hypothetical protein